MFCCGASVRQSHTLVNTWDTTPTTTKSIRQHPTANIVQQQQLEHRRHDGWQQRNIPSEIQEFSNYNIDNNGYSHRYSFRNGRSSAPSESYYHINRFNATTNTNRQRGDTIIKWCVCTPQQSATRVSPHGTSESSRL
jgi:hypothetical protein